MSENEQTITVYLQRLSEDAGRIVPGVGESKPQRVDAAGLRKLLERFAGHSSLEAVSHEPRIRVEGAGGAWVIRLRDGKLLVSDFPHLRRGWQEQSVEQIIGLADVPGASGSVNKGLFGLSWLAFLGGRRMWLDYSFVILAGGIWVWYFMAFHVEEGRTDLTGVDRKVSSDEVRLEMMRLDGYFVTGPAPRERVLRVEGDRVFAYEVQNVSGDGGLLVEPIFDAPYFWGKKDGRYVLVMTDDGLVTIRDGALEFNRETYARSAHPVRLGSDG